MLKQTINIHIAVDTKGNTMLSAISANIHAVGTLAASPEVAEGVRHGSGRGGGGGFFLLPLLLLVFLGLMLFKLKSRSRHGFAMSHRAMATLNDRFARGVFERFHRVDRERSGTGVGLAVTKSLVEAHGGEIVASSPGLGEGSSFVVRLPHYR